MDMIREQRTTIEGLRGDLRAALREAEAQKHDADVFAEERSTALREVKHQAELAVRLTIWMCRNDFAKEAAEIVGTEAVEALVKTLPVDDASKCYD